jgi:hypothetical protein
VSSPHPLLVQRAQLRALFEDATLGFFFTSS